MVADQTDHAGDESLVRGTRQALSPRGLDAYKACKTGDCALVTAGVVDRAAVIVDEAVGNLRVGDREVDSGVDPGGDLSRPLGLAGTGVEHRGFQVRKRDRE